MTINNKAPKKTTETDEKVEAKTTTKKPNVETKKEAPKEQPKVTKTLIEKIIDVVNETKPVSKDGRNDFSKYNYTTDAQVSSIVHQLARHGVWFIPSYVITDKWEKGKNSYVSVQGTFTLTDGKETYVGNMPGVGADSLDKAVYKAETGAKKNFFMQLLMLSTDTDTDDDHDKDMNSANAPTQNVNQQQAGNNATTSQINTLDQLIKTYARQKGGDYAQLEHAILSQNGVTSFYQFNRSSINKLIQKYTNKVNDNNKQQDDDFDLYNTLGPFDVEH